MHEMNPLRQSGHFLNWTKEELRTLMSMHKILHSGVSVNYANRKEGRRWFVNTEDSVTLPTLLTFEDITRQWEEKVIMIVGRCSKTDIKIHMRSENFKTRS